MNRIQDLGNRIVKLYLEKGYNLEPFLKEGLTKEEISQRFGKIKWPLCGQLDQFYRWRDGTLFKEGVALDQVYFFPPCYYLMSINQALNVYEELVSADLWQSDLFPILTDDGGNFFAVRCGIDSTGEIIFVSEEGDFHCSKNLYNFFATLETGIEKDLVYIDSEGYLNLKLSEFGSIGRNINPEMEYWDEFYNF